MSLRLQFVTSEQSKSSFVNALFEKGKIPQCLNPAVILFGVNELLYAGVSILAKS